jgi:hypothetical protein
MSAAGPDADSRLRLVNETVVAAANAAEHLRIGRLLEGHGDPIGAILAYRLAIQEGVEPAASEARRRIDALARLAVSAVPG